MKNRNKIRYFNYNSKANGWKKFLFGVFIDINQKIQKNVLAVSAAYVPAAPRPSVPPTAPKRGENGQCICMKKENDVPLQQNL